MSDLWSANSTSIWPNAKEVFSETFHDERRQSSTHSSACSSPAIKNRMGLDTSQGRSSSPAARAHPFQRPQFKSQSDLRRVNSNSEKPPRSALGDFRRRTSTNPDHTSMRTTFLNPSSLSKQSSHSHSRSSLSMSQADLSRSSVDFPSVHPPVTLSEYVSPTVEASMSSLFNAKFSAPLQSRLLPYSLFQAPACVNSGDVSIISVPSADSHSIRELDVFFNGALYLSSEQKQPAVVAPATLGVNRLVPNMTQTQELSDSFIDGLDDLPPNFSDAVQLENLFNTAELSGLVGSDDLDAMLDPNFDLSELLSQPMDFLPQQRKD